MENGGHASGWSLAGKSAFELGKRFFKSDDKEDNHFWKAKS